MKIWKTYKQFFNSSFQRELEFRANFFAKIIQSAIWMIFFVLIIAVIYRNTDSVAGWSEGQSYVLVATVFFMDAFVSAIFSGNLQELPEKVRKGMLDFDIVKPMDTQALVSIRKFNFDQIGTLIVGIGMIFVGLRMDGSVPTGVNVLSYAVFVFAAIAIFYSFELMLMTLGIWLVRVDNLWVLGETVFSVARFPTDIYSLPVRKFLTYGLPLALIATEPTRVLLGSRPTWFSLYGVCWALIFLLISRIFFKFALSRYTSASS
jgi:ABC-2 type transport system permease protein